MPLKTWIPSGNNALNVGSIQLLGANEARQKLLAYLAAGWTMLGSSNGGKATVNSVGLGTNFTIAFVSGTTWSLTDASGNNLFTADMVGSNLVLSNFANAGNNHTFVITSFVSSSVIRFAQGSFTPVAETGGATATWSAQAAAGMDGVDRLTSGVANFVWAAGGVAHWWAAIQSPAGMLPSTNRVTKTFAGSTGAANQHLQNVSHASAAPTAGSTTADPTQPANSRTFTNKQTVNSTNANSRWHSTRSTIGDVVYGLSRNTTGYLAYASMCATCTVGNETGSDYDCILVDAFTDGQPGALSRSNMSSTSHATIFAHDGTVSAAVSVVGWSRSGDGTWLGDSMSNANGQSNLSSLTMDYPITAFVLDAAHIAYKGQLTDFAWAARGPSSGALNGMSDPNTAATVNYVDWGDVFVPMVGLTADLSL